MQSIPAVANNKPFINSAEFVKLKIFNDYSNTANTTTYTFSSSYRAETINGTTYTPLGGLLAIGIQQKDLRVTSADTSISLSGIDGNNMSIVLGTKIRGSEIEIIRGFYNNNYVLANTANRFAGIVTSYNITENREANDDTFVITISCSSYKTVLENKVSGRKTNPESWKEFYPSDTSMNQVASLSDQAFDFGKKANLAPGTASTASADNTVITNSYTPSWMSDPSGA